MLNKIRSTASYIPPVAKAWHDGAIMAFDSNRFVSGGGLFTDYRGVPCTGSNGAFVTTGLPPVRGNDLEFKYGRGIRMQKGAYVAARAGGVASSVFVSSWTVDFWYKEETTNASSVRCGLMPFVVQAAFTVNSTTVRAHIADGGSGSPIGVWTIWNNQQTPRVSSSIPISMKGTEWAHFAIEYDSVAATTTIYKNGIALGSMNWRMQQVVSASGNIEFGAAAAPEGAIGVLERYRLTAGVRFGANFNVNEIYPYI